MVPSWLFSFPIAAVHSDIRGLLVDAFLRRTILGPRDGESWRG
jgi:hypothetical protein